MVRRRGFGHFGAGSHERVIEELTVITRVSDHVDDAHDSFFFFLSFFLFCSSSFLFHSRLVSCVCVFFSLYFFPVWIGRNSLRFCKFFFPFYPFLQAPSTPWPSPLSLSSAGFCFVLFGIFSQGLKRTLLISVGLKVVVFEG